MLLKTLQLWANQMFQAIAITTGNRGFFSGQNYFRQFFLAAKNNYQKPPKIEHS
jgi:hypothetical protein